MRIPSTLACCFILLVSAASARQDNDKVELKTNKDKASYGIGLSIGRNFQSSGLDLDPALVARGIRDALSKAKPLLTDEQLNAAIAAFQKEVQHQQALRRIEADPKLKAAYDKNSKDAETFLAANAKKEGVMTTKSGLQYKVLKAGAGKTPKATDVVVAHYRGTLIDGKEFDSSYKRDEPIEIPANRVIAGWTEALQLMKVGAKWQLFIPGELAYGLSGSPPTIGPNALLIFDIELLGIKSQPTK